MCTFFDEKDKLLFKSCSEKIINRTFEETDVLAFLIVIRAHLDSTKERHIKDIADLVAHRSRDRGVAFEAVKGAIAYRYRKIVDNGHKVVQGYQGIQYDDWKGEWEHLCNRYDIRIDDITIKEITLCVLSLLQFSKHKGDVVIYRTETKPEEKREFQATVFLLQVNDSIEAATLEDGLQSPYIGFFICRNVKFIKLYSGILIEDPVIAIRAGDGTLILQNDKGERIL